ncbi:hypothetical protein [Paenibacillus flagellatus]|uniref:Uncharacterized protein n=1 Tax=Paenibacillus flagellatus TaxID=2211139 RepID=A0A2V5KC94_9BACL|nr:hypothetical protein [Paenibacillus flagellatus]PYI57211.1 hypothetical protein DLM86_01855 [Paenibacillus flagellatus]
MDREKQAPDKKKHLFTVDILIEEPTNSLALAALLRALNHPNVSDFRVVQGIEFGKTIERTVQENPGKPFAIPPNKEAPGDKAGGAQSPQETVKPSGNVGGGKSSLSLENLLEHREKGTLVRIVAVKGKGVKLNIPCRILNFDSEAQQLTIYHVDEKKVYSFKLNEIEDIITG